MSYYNSIVNFSHNPSGLHIPPSCLNRSPAAAGLFPIRLPQTHCGFQQALSNFHWEYLTDAMPPEDRQAPFRRAAVLNTGSNGTAHEHSGNQHSRNQGILQISQDIRTLPYQDFRLFRRLMEKEAAHETLRIMYCFHVYLRETIPFAPVAAGAAYRPISALTSLKHWTAKSRSSRVWPAETWVRMRARPWGTTG